MSLLSEQSILSCALNATDTVPEWVELIPAGPRVVGVDRRWWMMTDPQAVLHFFDENNKSADLVVDYEHGQEKLAADGHAAPAAGWIKSLEIRDGAIWGQVKWTERAANHIRNGEYRYLSPVILYGQDNREIVGLKSVALVNQPNLSLKALNSRSQTQETEVNLSKLREALGLPETADEDAIFTAINSLKQKQAAAMNQSQPDMANFVPMATYTAALNRAETAEQSLANLNQSSRERDIETAINSALTSGKIAPADREYYTAACRADGGLERFNTFVAAKTPVVEPTESATGTEPGSPNKVALNQAERDVAKAMGLSEADMQKIKANEEAA